MGFFQFYFSKFYPYQKPDETLRKAENRSENWQRKRARKIFVLLALYLIFLILTEPKPYVWPCVFDRRIGWVLIGWEHYYSNSIVAGGFPVTSYRTLLTPFTSLTILLDTLPRTSHGSSAASAVMKSTVFTARSAMA